MNVYIRVELEKQTGTFVSYDAIAEEIASMVENEIVMVDETEYLIANVDQARPPDVGGECELCGHRRRLPKSMKDDPFGLYFRIARVLSDEFDALSVEDQDKVLSLLDQTVNELRTNRLVKARTPGEPT